MMIMQGPDTVVENKKARPEGAWRPSTLFLSSTQLNWRGTAGATGGRCVHGNGQLYEDRVIR